MLPKEMREAFIFGFLLLAGCHIPTDSRQGQPYVPYVTDQVIVNDSNVLKDGAGISLPLAPGHYRLEMTASSDGATAEFVGGNCGKTEATRQLDISCNMASQGQLVITNPTVFALGADVSVTVKVTKLAQ
jgi:hypothetical protein